MTNFGWANPTSHFVLNSRRVAVNKFGHEWERVETFEFFIEKYLFTKLIFTIKTPKNWSTLVFIPKQLLALLYPPSNKHCCNKEQQPYANSVPRKLFAKKPQLRTWNVIKTTLQKCQKTS